HHLLNGTYMFTSFWLWKVAGPTEPSTYTFSFNGTVNAAGAIVAYRGVDTSPPNNGFDTGTSQTLAAGKPLVVPSTTPSRAHEMLAALFVVNDSSGAVWTSADGKLRKRADAGWVVVFDALQSAPGSTGEESITCTGCSAPVGAVWFLALLPSSG